MIDWTKWINVWNQLIMIEINHLMVKIKEWMIEINNLLNLKWINDWS